MSQKSDYRQSHQAPDKGVSYDRSFREKPYRRYIWAWERRVLLQIVRECFGDRHKFDYLDFACGTGRILQLLEGYSGKAYGIDVSPSMLDVAREHVGAATLIQADITREAPLPETQFDLITAFRFFLNAQPSLREQAMEALGALLKPAGYLVFNVHMNHSCVLAQMIRVKRRLLRRDPFGFTTLGRDEVSRLVGNAGLEIVKTYHWGVIPIVNESTRLPMGLLHPFEKVASAIPGLQPWSRFVIYLCKKQGS